MMADKNSLKQMRRRKIDEAKKSMEYQEAEAKVETLDIQLSAKEEQSILDIAESEQEREQLRDSAIKAKKHVEALKLAKRQVNESVPSHHLVQRPGYGHLSAKMELHSHEAYRFLLGRAQRIITVDGKRIRQTRIVGLLHAASALKNITTGYQSGCPYACWTLCNIEEQIIHIRKIVKEAEKDAVKIAEFATNLKIAPFTSKNPSEVPLLFQSTYAYHFADLLTEYDLLLRSILNYKIQHFINIDEYKTFERKMGRPLRQLFRLTDNWKYVGKEAVETQNAKFQEAEHRMGVLPEDILNGQKTPKFVKKEQGDGDE